MLALPMSQTPYQQKLSLAAYDARVRGRAVAAEALNMMILAVAKGRYHEVGALIARLPPTYQAMIGTPPGSREDDR